MSKKTAKLTLYELLSALPKMEADCTFRIKGQGRTCWEIYDENENYFFVRQTLSKQMILLKKIGPPGPQQFLHAQHAT